MAEAIAAPANIQPPAAVVPPTQPAVPPTQPSSNANTEALIPHQYLQSLQPQQASQQTAEYQEFLAWKAAQSAPKTEPAKVDAPVVPGVDPAGALKAVGIDNTGDPVLDSLAKLLANSAPGIDLGRVLGKALEFGDARLIDFAHLAEKGGSNAAQLKTLAEGIVDRANQQSQAVAQNIYTQAGGKEVWDSAVAAFNQYANSAMKAGVKVMLESPNSATVAEAAKTVVEFARSNGHVRTVGQLVSGVPGSTGAGLSVAEFKAELLKLDPRSSSYNAAYASLVERRKVGKSAGM